MTLPTSAFRALAALLLAGMKAILSTARRGALPRSERFDSGVFGLDERFQFVPTVAGTWEYADRFAGGSGRLMAR